MDTETSRIHKDASLKIRVRNWFCVLGVYYTDADPEKAVLPTIIFINLKHPELKQEEPLANGFALCLGWWNMAARIVFAAITRKKQ